MSDDRQPSADAADFAALGAQLGRLRRLPVPPGLEARLLAAMPVGSRPGRPRLLRWAAWLTGTAAACLLVGVLSWQAGRNDRPAIVADHSRPSMAVRGPATRPASDNLGVQLAYHRTSDDLPGSQRNVGSNSFGRFGEEGRGGDVSITNARGGFAANTAGHFASTQPDGAIPLAGGKRGTPQGGGWAQSMEQNNTYFDGVDLPPDISSPARLGEAESNHRNRPDVGGRERSGLFSNKGQSRRAEPGDGPSAATGPAAVNDGEHTIAQIHPFGRKTAIPAAAVNHEDGLKQIEKPVPPATIESAEPGPLVPSRNLADGLIGHCPADGEANDDVGNHHGTFHGGVDYAPGKLAQAWRFNGKDGRIALANPTKADKDAFTISAWVKVAAAGAHQVVLSKWYLDGREGQSYCLGITPAMCPELALGPNGAGVVYITSPDAVTADKWHHLAATWNGKEARLYLDGASKGSLAIPSGLRASEAPWSVGAHDGAAGGSFHGLIDELSIWNRALSEEEVRALQTPRPFGRNPLAEGLVGLWTGEGNANDTVGRNHGTVRGKVTFVPGKVGQAFQVSGRDGYVDLGNPPALQLTGNMTTAMWVNPSRLDDLCCLLVRTQNRDSIHMTADGALHYCYGRNGDPRWEHIDLGSDGKTLHYIENNPPVVLKAQNPGRVLHVGEWTHVAIVRDLESHTLRWYFDGGLPWGWASPPGRQARGSRAWWTTWPSGTAPFRPRRCWRHARREARWRSSPARSS
ncbi:MAG: hypothetical protein NT031_18300 [Planctomycetota bacterium]|nr:hypothetical protein [Planctomycetota bacterium]